VKNTTYPNEPRVTTVPDTPARSKPQHARTVVAETSEELRGSTSGETTSCRGVARAHGVPESTLRSWKRRATRTGLPPEVLAFFESSAGLAFLHGLVVALLFVFALRGSCGLSLVRLFLTLTGLAPLVACSETHLRKRMQQLLDEVAQWGEEQKAKLAAGMQLRTVSLGADETFFKNMVLVAADLVSGFLLVEKTSDKRDASTWNEALKEGTSGLNLEVIQLVGDGASQLKALAKDLLGVPKVDELFHGQMAITRGTAGPLSAQVRQAEGKVAEATAKLRQVQQDRASYEAATQKGPECSPDWDAREERAIALQQEAMETLHQAAQRQEQVREATGALGVALHPVNLQTGAIQDAAVVQSQLDNAFEQIEQAADDAGLSERSLAKIRKAKRMMPSWVEAVQRWLLLVQVRLASLGQPAVVLALMIDSLIPAIYIGRVIAQTTDIARIDSLRALRTQLLKKLREPDGQWRTLPQQTRALLVQVAQDCVDLFQRSSSSIEGRNGCLSLHHHHLRGLRPQLLLALTVIHNYVLRRRDGTTAAQRFFGKPPDDLFLHLCQVMPLPARPRKRKRKTEEDDFLLQAA
jgi:hypothetical protein